MFGHINKVLDVIHIMGERIDILVGRADRNDERVDRLEATVRALRTRPERNRT